MATLLSSGNVLVTGGDANNVRLSSTEVYDMVAGSFNASGAMMAARDFLIAILLANGTVLVAGGSRILRTAPEQKRGGRLWKSGGRFRILRRD